MAESILKAMSETARGLHKAGTLETRILREFDALCLPPVKIYTPAQASGFLRDTVLHGYASLCNRGNGRPIYFQLKQLDTTQADSS